MKNIKQSDFTKKLFAIVLPIAFQNFMLALVSVSDAVMLGMIDQDSLSAVSLATQIQFVFNLFLTAMTVGTSMLVAQYWGKGDKVTVGRVFGLVMKLTILVSAAVTLIAAIAPNVLMYIFTNDPVLVQYGSTYLRAVSLSYLLCGISQIYLCIMKNSGRAGKSSAISSAAVVINIVLNAILIFGLAGAPKLGIAGAAIATVLARAIEMIWSILESFRPNGIRLQFPYLLHVERENKQEFWKYTKHVLANEFVWGLGFTMYSVILGHLGTDAVAANGIVNIVRNVLYCFCFGLASGGSIMVGNMLGAGKLEEAREYGSKLCKLAVLIGVITGLVVIALIPIATSLTDLSPTATTYLRWMLVMSSYYMIGKAVNCTTIGGIFTAGGDSRFGLLCDTVNMWCIIVPLGLLAAFIWKLPVLGVYFILSLDEVDKLPVVYSHYKKYGWVKNLTEKQKDAAAS